ncbi:uncharacterized protein LOC142538763 [Primulina tabacum]|uniref:uncharacterized protein LOC142538763 n=1 Tax=Primulina tabacum TaxID=48773 RepID=UPI003F598173
MEEGSELSTGRCRGRGSGRCRARTRVDDDNVTQTVGQLEKLRINELVLRDRVKMWWSTNFMTLDALKIVLYWDIFKLKFRESYCPPSFYSSKASELHNMKLGDMLVEKYADTFYAMLIYAPYVAASQSLSQLDKKTVQALDGALGNIILAPSHTSQRPLHQFSGRGGQQQNQPPVRVLALNEDEAQTAPSYGSSQVKPHESNCPVHELKLTAIVFSLKIWRHYLFLEQFIQGNAICVSKISIEPELIQIVKLAQKTDDQVQKYFDLVSQGHQSGFTIYSDVSIRLNGRLVAPDIFEFRIAILKESHCTCYSVQPRGRKMYHVIRPQFWWKNKKKDVAKFVSCCIVCQQVKAECMRPGGLLHHLEVPQWNFEHI